MTDTNPPADRTAARVAAIKARLATTSPTPWEPGDVWGWAGVVWTDQDERVWDGTGTRCAYCRNGDPLVRAEVRDINGEETPAHLHRRVEPWDLDSTVSDGNGGIVAHEVTAPADHALIVNAPSDLEFLLGRVEELERQLARFVAQHQPHDNLFKTCRTCKNGYGDPLPWPCEDAKALGLAEEPLRGPDSVMDPFEAADDIERRWGS